MKVRRFDPDDDLIIVKARVFGKHGDRLLNLALDTAASHTHVQPDKEPGYMLRVRRFESLGFGFNDFLIHVHDLPTGFGIDGLLGLSFLKRFNYEIRSSEGRILVTPIDKP